MRVFLAVSNLMGVAGGAQRSVVELANELVARGHQVLLAGFEYPETTATKPWFPMDPGVDLIRVERPHIRARRGKPALMDDRRRWLELHGPIGDALRGYAASWHPDIAVGFLPPTFTHLVKALGGDVPVVVANRNDPRYDYSLTRYSANPYDLRMRKWAAARATANLVLLESFVKDFPRRVQRRTFAIPNPIDPASATRAATRDQVIVAVGRLEVAKNHPLVVDAFARSGVASDGWVLHIYGRGTGEDELRRQIADLGVENSVRLMGVVPRASAPLGRAAMYVSGARFEGFSRALCEAMAAALPAVVVDQCRSNAELVTRSGCGLAVPSDADAFAAAIADLASSPDERARYGQRALGFAEQFAPRAVFDLWEDTLEALVDGRLPHRTEAFR